MNPRYLAYCLEHRQSPDDMLATDRQRYPGGCMCGFLLWMSARLQEWRRMRERERFEVMVAADHRDFLAYLAIRLLCGAAAPTP